MYKYAARKPKHYLHLTGVMLHFSQEHAHQLISQTLLNSELIHFQQTAGICGNKAGKRL